MNGVVIYLLLVNFCLAKTVTEKSNEFFKISMVSSEQNPSRPAVFAHGESPVWDPDTQSLYFVDVHKQNVHRLEYSTGKIHTKHIGTYMILFPKPRLYVPHIKRQHCDFCGAACNSKGYGDVNLVSLVLDSRRLLVAVRTSLFLLDWSVPGDDALRLVATVDHGQPDNVINEGKPDSEGRFWAGTKGPQTGDDVVPDKATLYSIEQESFTSPRAQLRPVSISNGLVWALNNSALYYVDSPTQKVEAFDYDPLRGDISNRRTIVDISNYGYEDAIPDGMTIDSNGHLWVALMFGGTVLHINPDTRQVIYGYKIPVTRVTSVCWGGPNLDELFVTTSSERVEAALEPLAGAIFTIRGTGSSGVHPNRFRFDNADLY